MGFIELAGLQDVKEKHPVPEGEWDLQITGTKYKEDKNQVLILLEVEGEKDAATVFYNFNLPNDDDDDATRQMKLLFTRRFLHHFGVDYTDGFDLEALPGMGAKCRLTQVEYPENSGRVSNNLQLPNLPFED